MKNNRIRLTEAQLHSVIRESVKRVLKEYEDPHFRGVRGFRTAFKDAYDGNERFGNWRDKRNMKADRSTGLDSLRHKGTRLMGRTGNALGKAARFIHHPAKPTPTSQRPVFGDETPVFNDDK